MNSSENTIYIVDTYLDKTYCRSNLFNTEEDAFDYMSLIAYDYPIPKRKETFI